jgi:general secretion pathway protein L
MGLYQSKGLKSLLRWWVRELAGLCRDASRLLPAGPLQTPELTLSKTAPLKLTFPPQRKRGGTPRSILLSNHEDLKRQIEVACAKTKRKLVVRLCIAQDACLVRRVRLPAAAGAELDRILALELERVTPFSAQDVCHGHRICAEESSGRELFLDHVIIKKELLEQLRGILCFGRVRLLRELKVLRRDEPPIHINLAHDFFASASERHRARTLRLTGTASLAICCGLLIAGLHWRQTAALAELASAHQAKAKNAMEVRAMLTEIERATDQIALLYRLRDEAPSPLEIWQEATRLLPDTAWLLELQIEANAVILSGFAKTSANVLEKLEASPLFQNASFTMPLTSAPGQSGEQFSLRLELQAPSGSASP